MDVDFNEADGGNLVHLFNPEAEFDENHEYLIDAVEWSCNGRFLLCASSVKNIDQNSPKIPDSS